jgi:membrane protease YdiL (CAAX protease family)
MATLDPAPLGPPPPPPPPAVRPPGFWWRVLSPPGAVVVAFVGAMVAAAVLSATPMGEDALVTVLQFVASSLILAFGVLLWRGLPAHERRAVLAIKRSRPRVIWTGIGMGLLIVFGAALLLAIGSAIDPAVEDRLEDQEEIGTAPWELVLWVVALIVLAPLGEELLFRGLMLRGLARRLRFWPAAAFSSLVFAAAHLDAYVLWPRALGIFATGLVLAWVYRTRGYWGSVAAHATVNAVASVSLIVYSTS